MIAKQALKMETLDKEIKLNLFAEEGKDRMDAMKKAHEQKQI